MSGFGLLKLGDRFVPLPDLFFWQRTLQAFFSELPCYNYSLNEGGSTFFLNNRAEIQNKCFSCIRRNWLSFLYTLNPAQSSKNVKNHICVITLACWLFGCFFGFWFSMLLCCLGLQILKFTCSSVQTTWHRYGTF